MDNTFHTHINVLKQAIEHNKLVVFAGAGVSRDAGIPTWDELKKELKKDINIDDDEIDALKIAQIYYNERDKKEYIDKVRQILKYKQVKYQPTHELIFKLNPLHIVTTNFDDLFEQVIEDKLYPFSTIIKDSDFPYALNTNFFVKVHGDLAEANIVLKEDDFLSYSRNHPLFEAFIRSVFASKVVLFLGYSFSDPNLQAIIQHVKDILGKDFQYAYLFNSSSNLHSSQKEYLKNKGIQLISYGEHGEEIESFLNGDNSVKTTYYQDYGISKPGQATCNFLIFLRHFNRFNEELKGKNFIDRLYDSLQRFKDIVCLDGNFTASLYPLKTKVSYYGRKFEINTDNEELLILYKDYTTNDKSCIHITNIEALNILERDKNRYEIKLTKITKQLNFSGIFWLIPHPPVGGQKAIPISIKSDECNCLSCRYLSFKLDEVAEELHAGLLPRDLNEKMIFGYVYYKFGIWDRAVKIFSEIALESWKAHRYILYYLCKKNIKSLQSLVQLDYGLPEKQREVLLKEIKDTDLDKLLNQLSGLSEDEYKLLKTIRDNEILFEASQVVNDNYIDILETYHYLRNGGWKMQWGETDISSTLNSIDRLFSFFWNNNIVIDAYKDFTDITKRAFEAIIASYATNDGYEAKLKKISSHILRLMVFYGDEKLKKHLVNYDIKHLSIDSEQKKDFIKLAKNFLKSFPKNPGGYGNKLNESIKTQLGFIQFRNNCSRYFSNFMVLLSYLDIKLEESDGLINDLLLFLEVQDFLPFTEFENLSVFIKSHPTLFDEDQINKLIKLFSRKQYRLRTENSFWWAIYTFKNDNLKTFTVSGEEIESILNNKSNTDLAFQDTLMALYFLTKDELQQKVKNRILKILKENFDAAYYEYLVSNKIIDVDDFKQTYLAQLSFRCTIEDNGGLPRWSNSESVKNSIAFLVYQAFPIEDILLQKVSEAPEFVKFALLPDDFNYTKFQVEWVYLYKYRPDVLQHLSKSKKFMEEFQKRKNEIENEKLKALCFSYFF